MKEFTASVISKPETWIGCARVVPGQRMLTRHYPFYKLYFRYLWKHTDTQSGALIYNKTSTHFPSESVAFETPRLASKWTVASKAPNAWHASQYAPQESQGLEGLLAGLPPQTASLVAPGNLLGEGLGIDRHCRSSSSAFAPSQRQFR